MHLEQLVVSGNDHKKWLKKDPLCPKVTEANLKGILLSNFEQTKHYNQWTINTNNKPLNK
jgi:hypothetical protein